MKDYMYEYFIPRLFKELERCKDKVSNCCGLCMNWNEDKDYPGCGECKLIQYKPLGFDCEIGKLCHMFRPAFQLEVGLHVHDMRIPGQIKAE